MLCDLHPPLPAMASAGPLYVLVRWLFLHFQLGDDHENQGPGVIQPPEDFCLTPFLSSGPVPVKPAALEARPDLLLWLEGQV